MKCGRWTKPASETYAALNMPVADHGSVLVDSDIEFGHWDSSLRVFTPLVSPPDAVRVTTRRTAASGNSVGLYFAQLLGFVQTDVTATAIAIGKGGGGAGAPVRSRFLIDSEMFDTDIPAIEQLAASLGTTC